MGGKTIMEKINVTLKSIKDVDVKLDKKIKEADKDYIKMLKK